MCGLAAGSVLGEHATIVERENRPGGLVRTEQFGSYWCDHVIHILYFSDEETERHIRSLVPELAPCPPEAWVNTTEGRLKYPFQMHLSGLPRESIVECLRDLAEVSFRTPNCAAENFEQTLRFTFGEAMCELFLFPYNRKVWKRPLTSLASVGFQWTITPPQFDEVLRGALDPDATYLSYNANGWYPRPSKQAPLRGMEVVAASLASQASDLRLNHTVTSLDLEKRVASCLHHGREVEISWKNGLCSTIPLPVLIRICRQAPESLRADAARLKWNRVISVMFCVRGPRPSHRGHWEYYSDESLCFTRIIYMHRFDPEMVPADGWCVMAEIIERAEEERKPDAEIAGICREDMKRAGLLPDDCEIVHEHVTCIDPAYVVFSHERPAILDRLKAFLAQYSVTSLGRYGEWEYSSVGGVLRDGRNWASRALETVSVK